MVGKERPPRKTKHNPLADDVLKERYAETTQERQKYPPSAEGVARPLSADVTRKVHQLAKRLPREDDGFGPEEEADEMPDFDVDIVEGVQAGEEEEADDVVLEYDDSSSVASTYDDVERGEGFLELDPEEEKLLSKFQPATSVQARNLADIIMEKIREQKHRSLPESGADSNEPKIDRRVAKIYLAIGEVLKRYTAGKIPKAFKVLPHVQNWEELLWLTKPHEWSPHAVYAATRIFASALNEKMAQRFYSAFLLPIIHSAIESNKKLHPAQYQAVRKALFKPIAFYKGFLLPLVVEPEFECTLKESLVIGSILQKCHLPPVPTAVVIVKMSEVPFSSAQCVLLRVLIDKKLTLPFQCIDALVLYFYRFCSTHASSEKLPVLWHQTLLLFVTYYRASLTDGQVDLLRRVCGKHFHYHLTPEVRRVLNQ